MLEVPLVQLDPDLPVPAYAKPGDAGVDLRAREATKIPAGGGRVLVPTGVAIAVPPGHAAFVQPRSGLALTHGVTVLNSPGLVDSGYRGELKVLLINTDPIVDFEIKRGERIAQLVIQQVEHATFTVVDELPSSDRGVDGFGSSGKH
jgi:dUTP pyrophosphatase